MAFRIRKPSNLAFTTVSATDGLCPVGCNRVLLSATSACYVSVTGPGQTIAIGGGLLLPASWPITLVVADGETVNVIQSAAAGTLNICYGTESA